MTTPTTTPTTTPEARAAPLRSSVMAVVVVYERALECVEAWPLVRTALAAPDGSAIGLRHVLVYDNSATPQAQPDAGLAGCSYLHDQRNRGTAAAYGIAAERATGLGIEWLLLLDQDTRLPADFFRATATAVQSVGTDTAALLPWVGHESAPVSPARITRAGSIRPLTPAPGQTSAGIRLTGIASGALVRVASLRSLGGFPTALWLDYVDHWMFAQFRRRGLQIGILDARLEHDLSVANPASLSPRRLSSILAGENMFVRQLGWLARLVHPIRLLLRAARLWPVQRAHSRRVLAFLFLRR